MEKVSFAAASPCIEKQTQRLIILDCIDDLFIDSELLRCECENVDLFCVPTRRKAPGRVL